MGRAEGVPRGRVPSLDSRGRHLHSDFKPQRNEKKKTLFYFTDNKEEHSQPAAGATWSKIKIRLNQFTSGHLEVLYAKFHDRATSKKMFFFTNN